MEWKWVNDGQLASSFGEKDEDICGPSSMPADWNNRSDFLGEWENPWYSHGPGTVDKPCNRVDPEVFCSESAPRKAAAAGPAFRIAAVEPCARHQHPGLRCEAVRCGQAWTVALCALWGCRDTHGLEASLSLMAAVALALFPSELGQAFAEFDSAIKKKRASSAEIFTPSVENLVVSVAAKLKQEATACLPQHVLQFVLEFVSISENGALCAVSKEFREAAEADALWRGAYEKRFLSQVQESRQDGEGDPSAAGGVCGGTGGSGGDGGAAAAASTVAASGGEISVDGKFGRFKHRYNMRMQDPHVGDKVEVAWKGKFRLESFEVYNGTAWWVARVVDKGKRPGHYKVHYPGWEEKWDEWVPRDRLRWGNESLAVPLERRSSPVKGDSVEVWCQGLHVPGAWLEAVVYEVEKGRLHLGEVLTSGCFWVDVKHVRLVKQNAHDVGLRGGQQEEAFEEMSVCRKRSILLEALSDAGFTGGGDGGCYCFCCVM